MAVPRDLWVLIRLVQPIIWVLILRQNVLLLFSRV